MHHIETKNTEQPIFSSEAPPSADRIPRSTARVVITPIVVILNVLVFVAMALSGVSALDPDAGQLIHWGANFGPRTLYGEWWRLLSAAFLHIGLLHLALNMQCLWSLGHLAERLFGNGAFFALYLFCGIGGSIASVWWNPTVVGAGASGAIFGVAGGLLVFLYKGQLGIARREINRKFTSVSIFVGYNLIFGFTQAGIDNAAHLGGFATGLVMGVLLLRSQPAPGGLSRRPRYAALSVMSLLLLLGAGLAKTNVNDTALLQERAYVHYNQGMDHLEQDELDLAIEEYTKAIDLDPEIAQAYINRGVAHMRGNEFRAAIADFDRAIAIDPQLPEATYNRGLAFAFLGQFYRALDDLSAALEQYPDQGVVRFFRGMVYAELGEPANAIRDLRKALEIGLDPDFEGEARALLQELTR